jgi:hypothetical protein
LEAIFIEYVIRLPIRLTSSSSCDISAGATTSAWARSLAIEERERNHRHMKWERQRATDLRKEVNGGSTGAQVQVQVKVQTQTEEARVCLGAGEDRVEGAGKEGRVLEFRSPHQARDGHRGLRLHPRQVPGLLEISLWEVSDGSQSVMFCDQSKSPTKYTQKECHCNHNNNNSK